MLRRKNRFASKKYLDNYRFPEVVGLSHVPESILWQQINAEYGTWYTNEVVRVDYVGEGGNSTAKATLKRHLAPSCYYYKWRLMHPLWYKISFMDFVYYSLFYFLSDQKYRQHNPYTKCLDKHRVILALLCPVTYPGAFFIRLLKRIR